MLPFPVAPQRTIRDVVSALLDGPLLARPRAQLAKAVRDRVAGESFTAVHEEVWNAPGERWFTDGDPIWRVHEDTSMFIGGIRALLLQSLHPVAMWGVHEHSGYRGDPWGRLQRISHFIAFTTYGPVDAAEQRIERLRRIHQQVAGTTADGQPYRADDPELLTWVHAAEIDSFLESFRTFGRRRISATEADTYIAQTALVAEKLGVPSAPRSVAELDDLITSYRPVLAWSRPAQDAADLLIKDPPLPIFARPAYAALVNGAISLLPHWARSQLRLPSSPIADRVLSRPAARLATSTIRWALTGGGRQSAV